MITYEVDKEDLKNVQEKLKDIEKGAPTALMKAINRTAKVTRKKLQEGINKSYTVKTGGFNSRMVIHNASRSKLYAVINSKSRTMTIGRFKTSVPKKSGGKADIVKSGLKQLIGPRNIKAFKAKGLIMQRETKDRYPVKVLRSNSVSKMIESVYKGKVNDAVEPTVKETLHNEIEKEVEKLIQKGA